MSVPGYYRKDFASGGTIWFGDHDVVRFAVYAGAMPKPSRQGAVLLTYEVYGSGPYRNLDLRVGVFPAPTDTGLLRIVDAVGARLLLSSESGTWLTFDAPTRTFALVSAPTDKASSEPEISSRPGS